MRPTEKSRICPLANIRELVVEERLGPIQVEGVVRGIVGFELDPPVRALPHKGAEVT